MLLIGALCTLFAGCSGGDENAGDQQASVTYFNEAGEKINTDFFYPNGKLRSKVTYSQDGYISNRQTYIYDDDFRLLEIRDSISLSKQVFEYDKKGRQISQYTEDFAGRSGTTSSYLEDGRLRIDSNQVGGHLTITRLDERGNELEMWKVNGFGTPLIIP